MVYCGKPSKACRQCRNRNIKCDKKRDSCGQCLRAKLHCPGYHDPKDLIFRNQTEETISKATTTLIPPQLNQPIIVKAKFLFVSRNVFARSSWLYYIQHFHPPKDEDLHFINSLRAVSLAYLAFEESSPPILQKARRNYGSALMFTNKALQEPNYATADVTLLTVILLDLFERMTKGNSDPEIKHIEGALTLLKLRGTKQFLDPTGLSMFHHLSCNIASSFLKRGIAVSPDLLILRSRAAHLVDTDDPKWRLCDLLIKCAAVRENLREGTLGQDDIGPCIQDLKQQFDEVSSSFEKIIAAERPLPDDLVLNGMHQKLANNYGIALDVVAEMLRSQSQGFSEDI